jgi:4-hydroxy-2-oxoheptanedioate aldolase
MRTNPLVPKLAQGQPCRGCWVNLPSPHAARLLARLPLDWLVIDTEHAPIDVTTMSLMVAAICEGRGPAPIVRVPQAGMGSIKYALDAGAYGIVVPMINSRAEAEQAIAWAKYPPMGQRSYGSQYPHLAFDTERPEYLRVANQQTIVVLQIETVAAVNHLDEIFSVPGFDVAFVGPVDLQVSLGLDPTPENQHPRFLEALEEIKQAGKRHNKPLGIFCSNGKAAAQRIQEGFQFVNVATDTFALLGGVRAELDAG